MLQTYQQRMGCALTLLIFAVGFLLGAWLF